MISDMMREKTMREVSAAASSRRPEGVSHMLRDSSDNAAEAEEPQYAAKYAAKYDDDSDEWGGPKGSRTPRSLDAARAATHAGRNYALPPHTHHVRPLHVRLRR